MWELDHKEGWATKNWCFWAVVLKKTLESCLDYKEIKPVNPKGNQTWIFIGKTDAEAEALILESTHWKRPWCWDRLRAGGEGDGKGWDGWMASPTEWAWIRANSGRYWRTGKPGVRQFMGLQGVGHNSHWTATFESNRAHLEVNSEVL